MQEFLKQNLKELLKESQDTFPKKFLKEKEIFEKKKTKRNSGWTKISVTLIVIDIYEIRT